MNNLSDAFPVLRKKGLQENRELKEKTKYTQLTSTFKIAF